MLSAKSKKYIFAQLSEIREGGIRFFFRKIFIILDLVFLCLISPVIFLLLVIIHSIKRWKHIRFGYFIGTRIGHFAADVGISYAERILSKDIFYDFYFIPKPIANEQWYKMACRNFKVYKFVQYFYQIETLVWKNSQHVIVPPIIRLGSRDMKGVMQLANCPIPFLESENEFCKNWLKKKGWNEQKFVCLVVRDDAYLQSFKKKDWSYHDYRNSDINTYCKTVDKLIEMGYWVIRIGKAAKERLQCESKRFIDFPFLEDRTDLFDIWLMANCHFTITTGTGIDSVSEAYLKPIIYVNYLPMCYMNTWLFTATFPKLLRWEKNFKPLTLIEYLKNSYVQANKYQEAGITIDPLSSDEILSAVLEFEARLSGLLEETQIAKERQEKFWQKMREWEDYSNYYDFIHPKTRIASAFLDKMGNEFLD